MAIHNSMFELCCYAAFTAIGIASKSPDPHRVFQHPLANALTEPNLEFRAVNRLLVSNDLVNRAAPGRGTLSDLFANAARQRCLTRCRESFGCEWSVLQTIVDRAAKTCCAVNEMSFSPFSNQV